MRARTTPSRALLAGALVAIAAGAGCGGGTNACKQGTLFVTVTLAGTTSAANQISVSVSVDGGTPRPPTTLSRTAGASQETIEIDFPNTYPAGMPIDVTIQALMNGTVIATKTGTVAALPEGCGALTIALGGGGPAGGGGTSGSGGAAGRGGAGGAQTARGGAGGATGGAMAGRGGAGGSTGGATAGHGGTGGSAAGTGGRGGTGGSTVGPPSCRFASFDSTAESFILNPYNNSPGNLALREGGAAATIGWTNTEGEPTAGALRVEAPFNDYDQFVDVVMLFPSTGRRDWTGTKLHVRVKIASGLDHSPNSPPGVQPYANSYNAAGDAGLGYHYRGNYVTVTNAHGWADYVVDLAGDGDFDPTKIDSIGVTISTGNGLVAGVPNPVKPTGPAAVIYIDSFWLEGTCSGGTGGFGGGTGGAGGTGPTNCKMGLSPAPSTALITDFSDATADPVAPGEIRYGASGGMHGGTARFASGTRGTLSLSGGALTFTATVEAPSVATMYPWNGFALYMDGPGCVNASGYTGVSFTLSNVTGACPLLFKFTDAAHIDGANDPNRGLCSGSCFGADHSIVASTTQVAFAATPAFAGSPATPTDPSKLTDLQFQLQPAGSAACTTSITLDNIRFY